MMLLTSEISGRKSLQAEAAKLNARYVDLFVVIDVTDHVRTVALASALCGRRRRQLPQDGGQAGQIFGSTRHESH